MFVFLSSSQLRVVAYDSANPSQRATATVAVQMSRNEFGPVFSRAIYPVDVVESWSLGQHVVQASQPHYPLSQKIRSTLPHPYKPSGVAW